MIIRTEQFDALQHQQESKSTPSHSGEGFENLLAQELGQENQTAQTAQPLPKAEHSLVGALQMGTQIDSAQAMTEDVTLQQVITQMDGLLDNWDAYANQLAGGGTQLRGAYNVLQGMEQSLGQISSTMQSIKGQHPALNDTLNEIAVMTATEKFKFNRGDYM